MKNSRILAAVLTFALASGLTLLTPGTASAGPCWFNTPSFTSVSAWADSSGTVHVNTSALFGATQAYISARVGGMTKATTANAFGRWVGANFSFSNLNSGTYTVFVTIIPIYDGAVCWQGAWNGTTSVTVQVPMSASVSCFGSPPSLEYFCTVHTLGGSGSFTYNWNWNGVYYVTHANVDEENLDLVLGQCRSTDEVSVTVRDSLGATASSSTTLHCF